MSACLDALISSDTLRQRRKAHHKRSEHEVVGVVAGESELRTSELANMLGSGVPETDVQLGIRSEKCAAYVQKTVFIVHRARCPRWTTQLPGVVREGGAASLGRYIHPVAQVRP